MNQTWENGKKPNFGPNFGLFGPNLGPKIFFVCSNSTTLLDVRHCRKLSPYAISRKTYDPNSRKWRKTSFWTWLGSLDPDSGRQYFSKIWLRQLWDIMVSYHHEHYQKKLMIQPWESFVMDGRTDGQADRQIDRRTRMIS